VSSKFRNFALITLFGFLVSGPASAQYYAASAGSGTSCNRSLPCALSTAISSAPAGTTIFLLDAILDRLTINKSLTIRGISDSAGIIWQANAETASIYVQAGAADIITIDNIHLAGGGIDFNRGGHLHVMNCIIGDQTPAGSSGIKFQPDSAAKLSVVDTIIKNVGTGTGGGIVVNPQSGGSARVNIERATINGGAFGIAADGNRSTAGINMTIADSMIGGATQDGVIATTTAGGSPIGVYLTNTKSVNNNIGVRSLGPNVTVRLDNSSVVGNGLGLSFASGGALLTYGNNKIVANGANGSFTSAIPTQ
jgi:hypothetical protein